MTTDRFNSGLVDSVGDIRIIVARDLEVGMTILNGKRPVRVDSIEYDKCATRGLHVNAVRRPNNIKHKGRWVPNPEGGRLVYCDGCYDRATVLTVQMPDALMNSA